MDLKFFKRISHKLIILILSISFISLQCSNNLIQVKKPLVSIIIGSTRKGRCGDKIGRAIKKILSSRKDATIHVLDLKDYNLPFLESESSELAKNEIKKWSDKIESSDGFIIIVGEYNHSFPAVLKNAIDHLLLPWANKPVGLVGYSGGKSGGARAIEQLRSVLIALKMKPSKIEINIPTCHKAFNRSGKLIDSNIEYKANQMLDELLMNPALRLPIRSIGGPGAYAENSKPLCAEGAFFNPALPTMLKASKG